MSNVRAWARTLVLAACAVLPGEVLAANPAEIVVDYAKPVSDTGGDDLAAMRRIFQSASAPEANGGLEPVWPIAARLGMQAVRIINDASECGQDVAGRIDRCNRLDGNLRWAARYRLTPHIIVGQTQPPHLMAVPGAKWTTKEWAQYASYAEALVRHVALHDGRGFEEALFEVGNEVDITGEAKELWTVPDPRVPQGHASRYDHYERVYAVWARAIAKVAAQFPEKRLLVAGPAMGGQGLFLNSGTMVHDRFVAFVAKEKLALDVLTLHFYGDFIRGWPQAKESHLAAQLRRMHDALKRHGRADVPIHISEWAAAEDTNAPINTRHEGGAYAAAFVIEALAGGVRGGSYWLTRDALGADQNGIAGIGSYSHVRAGRDVPKPQANVFTLMNMLPGTRRAAQTPADLRAIAAGDGRRAAVLASNYGWNFWTGKDESMPREVRITLRNLPIDGEARIARYVVDEKTANIAASPEADGALRVVEETRARIVGGALQIPPRMLGKSAVSLWLIEPLPGR